MSKRIVDATVVIPCFNGKTRGYMVRAIESVLAQTVAPARFVVVDDGSTDGSHELIQAKFPDVEVLRKPNGGLPTARNAALRTVTTKYVAFLDDDDVWMPEKLASQVDFLESHPEFDVVFCGVTYIDSQGAVLGSARPVDWGLAYPEILFGNAFLPPSTITFRKSLIDKAGDFDVRLRQGEDYEYLIRCAKHGRIATQDEPHVHYRQHGAQMSASLTGIDDATLAIIKSHADAAYPEDGVHFVRFFAYGASIRALLRRDFATARRFAVMTGPVALGTYLIRFIGIALAPLAVVKGAWRRFEHRRMLRLARIRGT